MAHESVRPLKSENQTGDGDGDDDRSRRRHVVDDGEVDALGDGDGDHGRACVSDSRSFVSLVCDRLLQAFLFKSSQSFTS